jgi:hypothetical protein
MYSSNVSFGIVNYSPYNCVANDYVDYNSAILSEAISGFLLTVLLTTHDF